MDSFSEILEFLHVQARPQRNGEANRRILANSAREPASKEHLCATNVGIYNPGASLTTNMSITEYKITYGK
jgi:hypothetical protein